MTRKPQPLRLPKRHAATESAAVSARDGARIIAAQSLRDAVVAGLVVIIVFSFLWVLLTRATDRVFPWMTILQGVFIGLAIRRAGRGVQWPFPALAAVMGVVGALVGNVVVAASNTAEELGTGTLHILRAVTTMTWPGFFTKVLGPADYVYAVVAALLAGFYANRRLTRSEYRAVRLWREGRDER